MKVASANVGNPAPQPEIRAAENLDHGGRRYVDQQGSMYLMAGLQADFLTDRSHAGTPATIAAALSCSALIAAYLGHRGKHCVGLTASLVQEACDAHLLRFAERNALRVTNSFLVRGAQALA